MVNVQEAVEVTIGGRNEERVDKGLCRIEGESASHRFDLVETGFRWRIETDALDSHRGNGRGLESGLIEGPCDSH
jgi:hypothetical protein